MATPWTKIRAEWLKGGITQKELAEKYHVNLKTLQNRASKEGWKNSKGKIREKVEEETRERVVRARVNHLEKLILANDQLVDALVQLTEMIAQKPNVMLYDAGGTLRNAESMAKALATATETQRDLYKIPNIDQKLAEKKLREQLKLEKMKLGTGSTEKDIWTIQLPEGEAPVDE